MTVFFRGKRHLHIMVACLLTLMSGCAARKVPSPHVSEVRAKGLPRMGYTVQVGAFVKTENAARLTNVLRRQGIQATYFVAEKGLFKVRFGNFSTRNAALNKAQALQEAGNIDVFYIVSPGEYAVARKGPASPALREELVKTARSFLGVPYLWGGTDAENGFDCSGLTMTVYQLNGLDLPRTAAEQIDTGSTVELDSLTKGDLVFFRTTNRGKASHVGLYAGKGLFIHAPGRGKKISLESLSRRYYRQHYVGGRRYM